MKRDEKRDKKNSDASTKSNLRVRRISIMPAAQSEPVALQQGRAANGIRPPGHSNIGRLDGGVLFWVISFKFIWGGVRVEAGKKCVAAED